MVKAQNWQKESRNPFAAGTSFQSLYWLCLGSADASQSLCSRDKFSIQKVPLRTERELSQSLCSGDKFSIYGEGTKLAERESQSLCSRDKFSIVILVMFGFGRRVAIPLQQGQVFNNSAERKIGGSKVAIPLRQGQVFNDSGKTSYVVISGRNPFAAGTSFQ